MFSKNIPTRENFESVGSYQGEVHPLVTFASNVRSVQSCEKIYNLAIAIIIIATIAIIVGASAGVIVHGPIHPLTPTGNIVLIFIPSIGVCFCIIKLIDVKKSKKLAEFNKKTSIDELFNALKSSHIDASGFVQKHFYPLLSDDFSEEDWKLLIPHIDQQFREESTLDDATKQRIINHLISANPIVFAHHFNELASQNQLDESFCTFVKKQIDTCLQNQPSWDELLRLLKDYPSAYTTNLMQQMIALDPNKFTSAYLKNSPLFSSNHRSEIEALLINKPITIQLSLNDYYAIRPHLSDALTSKLESPQWLQQLETLNYLTVMADESTPSYLLELLCERHPYTFEHHYKAIKTNPQSHNCSPQRVRMLNKILENKQHNDRREMYNNWNKTNSNK